MMKTERRQQAYRYGLNAEKIAAVFLRGKGYRILHERYRNFGGEIDLLARRGKTLVAVEVKARRTLEECEETVPPRKQRKIARAMEAALATLDAKRECAIRFDVVWIAPWRLPVHIKDAWRM